MKKGKYKIYIVTYSRIRIKIHVDKKWLDRKNDCWLSEIILCLRGGSRENRSDFEKA